MPKMNLLSPTLAFTHIFFQNFANLVLSVRSILTLHFVWWCEIHFLPSPFLSATGALAPVFGNLILELPIHWIVSICLSDFHWPLTSSWFWTFSSLPFLYLCPCPQCNDWLLQDQELCVPPIFFSLCCKQDCAGSSVGFSHESYSWPVYFCQEASRLFGGDCVGYVDPSRECSPYPSFKLMSRGYFHLHPAFPSAILASSDSRVCAL